MESMNMTLEEVICMKNLLDYLTLNQSFVVQYENLQIRYEGIVEDTAKGKRQIFQIVRKVD